MEEKQINISQLEEKLLLEKELLNKTYIWWKNQLNEKAKKLIEFNANPAKFSEEEIDQITNDVKNLVIKANREILFQRDYEKRSKQLFFLKKKEKLDKFRRKFGID